jgi:hypothetical protein
LPSYPPYSSAFDTSQHMAAHWAPASQVMASHVKT